MITCTSCHKTIPPGDRFCAYCGTRQPFRLPWFGHAGGAAGTQPALAWRPGTPMPRQVLAAGLGGGLGALVGAGAGVLLGNVALCAVMGALGAGAAAAVAELSAGAIPDEKAAQRFGLVLGGLGGLLGLPGGLLVLATVIVLAQGLDGLVFLRNLMRVQFTFGVLGTIVGTAAGLFVGGLAGYFLGQGGYRFGRRGALLGAALAWALAAGVAGAFAGNYAAQIIGLDRLPSVRLGIVLQMLAGAGLLYVGRPLLGRIRWWWVRRP